MSVYTDVERALGLTPTSDDGEDGLVHIVCCQDDNLGLCGGDLTPAAWVEPGDTIDCVVCIDIRSLPQAERCKACPFGRAP